MTTRRAECGAVRALTSNRGAFEEDRAAGFAPGHPPSMNVNSNARVFGHAHYLRREVEPSPCDPCAGVSRFDSVGHTSLIGPMRGSYGHIFAPSSPARPTRNCWRICQHSAVYRGARGRHIARRRCNSFRGDVELQQRVFGSWYRSPSSTGQSRHPPQPS